MAGENVDSVDGAAARTRRGDLVRLVRRDRNAEWLHMLAAAYAVGALGESERVAFERHLPRCARCAQEVREFGRTVARLADAVASEPPAELADTTIARFTRRHR